MSVDPYISENLQDLIDDFKTDYTHADDFKDNMAREDAYNDIVRTFELEEEKINPLTRQDVGGFDLNKTDYASHFIEELRDGTKGPLLIKDDELREKMIKYLYSEVAQYYEKSRNAKSLLQDRYEVLNNGDPLGSVNIHMDSSLSKDVVEKLKNENDDWLKQFKEIKSNKDAGRDPKTNAGLTVDQLSIKYNAWLNSRVNSVFHDVGAYSFREDLMIPKIADNDFDSIPDILEKMNSLMSKQKEFAKYLGPTIKEDILGKYLDKYENGYNNYLKLKKRLDRGKTLSKRQQAEWDAINADLINQINTLANTSINKHLDAFLKMKEMKGDKKQKKLKIPIVFGSLQKYSNVSTYWRKAAEKGKKLEEVLDTLQKGLKLEDLPFRFKNRNKYLGRPLFQSKDSYDDRNKIIDLVDKDKMIAKLPLHNVWRIGQPSELIDEYNIGSKNRIKYGHFKSGIESWIYPSNATRQDLSILASILKKETGTLYIIKEDKEVKILDISTSTKESVVRVALVKGLSDTSFVVYWLKQHIDNSKYMKHKALHHSEQYRNKALGGGYAQLNHHRIHKTLLNTPNALYHHINQNRTVKGGYFGDSSWWDSAEWIIPATTIGMTGIGAYYVGFEGASLAYGLSSSAWDLLGNTNPQVKNI